MIKSFLVINGLFDILISILPIDSKLSISKQLYKGGLRGLG